MDGMIRDDEICGGCSMLVLRMLRSVCLAHRAVFMEMAKSEVFGWSIDG